jgi:hypothetical protein
MQMPIQPSDDVQFTIEDIVKKVEQRSSDIHNLFVHTRDGTMDEFYSEIVDEVIFDITIFPVERSAQQVEVQDDQKSVVRGLHHIAEIIADVFGRPQHDVELDILERMNEFPVDDVRQSRTLYHKNLLH